MNTERSSLLKRIIHQLWMIMLKIVKVLKQGLSMLWPDKTFTSRLCFGMAFLCTTIFVINAVVTLLISAGYLVVELGMRADKELKVARMVCDRAEECTDTIRTDSLFQMIMASGIDNKYTICITDTANNLLACSLDTLGEKGKKGNLAERFNWSNDDSNVLYNINGKAHMQVVGFNNTMNICLSDTISGTGYKIMLLEPMDSAMDSAATVVKTVSYSSLICFALLVICYLIMLFVLRRTSARNKQIESELDVAASIQKQMVPLDFSAFPEHHGYSLHGFLQPAKTMGGDLLDYVLRDDKLFFCIGDVSGKGMPAALFMSEVHVLFHHVLAFEQEPAKICVALNNSLSEHNDSNMFCTLFLGVIDFATNTLTYCNAGHNPPIAIDTDGHATFVDVLPNIALGLFPDMPYESQQIEFPIGTTLVTYTDGVTEAESISNELLGEQTVLDILTDKHRLSPEQIITLMTTKIEEHAKLTDQSDDITILALKRTPA